MTYNKTPKVGRAYVFYFNGMELPVMVSHVEEDVIRGRLLELDEKEEFVNRKREVIIYRSSIAAFLELV